MMRMTMRRRRRRRRTVMRSSLHSIGFAVYNINHVCIFTRLLFHPLLLMVEFEVQAVSSFPIHPIKFRLYLTYVARLLSRNTAIINRCQSGPFASETKLSFSAPQASNTKGVQVQHIYPSVMFRSPVYRLTYIGIDALKRTIDSFGAVKR
jgi:hypothetical protein